MKQCLRCFDSKPLSAIGERLFNFVCDDCRRDANPLHLGHDSTISDMEYKKPMEIPNVKEGVMSNHTVPTGFINPKELQ